MIYRNNSFLLIGFIFFVISGIKAQTNTQFSRIDLAEINSKYFSVLKENFKDKQFVLIGESSHGVSEFGKFKVELSKFLIDSLGYSTILMESGLSDIQKWTKKEEKNYDSLVYSLFPIWHTDSYLELCQYIKDKPVNVYGIDPQNSSKFFSVFPYEQIYKIDKDMATLFLKIDKEWSKEYSKPISSWDSSIYIMQRKAIETYDLILKKIKSIDSLSSENYIFLNRILENRLAMAKAVNKSADMFHRDSIMKDNIDWLLKNILKKDDKIIILSHNSHIAREKNMNVGYLGYLMSKKYDSNMFVIAQYFESGIFVNNARTLVSMPKPLEGSFESYLSQFKSQYQVFNLKSKALSKKVFNKPISTYYMGSIIQNLNLSKNYDMILTVKVSSLPVFID